MTINLKLELPKELEKHLEYLTILSKRPKDFIIKEAIIQYLEDAEDIQAVKDWMSQKDKKFYTSEELDNLLEQKGLKSSNV